VPVDPTLVALLPALAATMPADLSTLDPVAYRRGLETLAARCQPDASRVRSVEEVVLPHGQRARVYRPHANVPVATVLALHGGGFVLGSINTNDHLARELCAQVGGTVVSVEYRLAPEHRFPAGLEDCLSAWDWMATTFAGAPLAVAGDSAGGNLAAVVAQERRDKVHAQLLIYPVTDLRDVPSYPSRVDNDDPGLLLTMPLLRWFFSHYAAPGDDPRASPVLAADLTGVPPAVVIPAGHDPLRDEGEAYATLLQRAGVDVRVRRFDELVHGFSIFATEVPSCAAAMTETCALFADLLNRAGPRRPSPGRPRTPRR
jgi:acetyl esterase